MIRSFSAPNNTPVGLVWDGRTLWCADDGTDTIYQVDPVTGTVIRSFSCPSTKPRGLAWDGRTLWHVDTNTDLVYQLSVN